MEKIGITNTNKTLSTDHIDCEDSFKVKLSLTAEPDIVNHPTDIVLILDRSQSMAGSPLANLKNGAKKFIDIIDESTDSEKDGQIGYGSRIGIVSFSETATQDTQLITSVEDLKKAVDALSSNGRTNHNDAFTKALQLFSPTSTNAKVMIMFTDGRTTIGGDASPVAKQAKEQGVTIYCIGLSGNGGIDTQALIDWASNPASAYVVITPSDEELETIFSDLAQNISKPGAKDIIIRDVVSSCFKIISFDSPTKGSASLLNETTLQWKIDELGTKASEGASLEFTVKHIGSCSGTVEVNNYVSYEDKDLNIVSFPSPEIEINCGDAVFPERCPTPVSIPLGGCEDAIEFDGGDINLESLGRILQLDMTIKNVCPNRRVALAVIITEVDRYGIEHNRGIKTMTIPAHTKKNCSDVTVRCIKFVLPEDLDVSGSSNMICDTRNFKARFIAHYIDNDFECCNNVY